MASPDLTPYIDLTLYDRDAPDLVANALSQRQNNTPDYNPVTGDPELELMEALAIMVSELGYSMNRLVNNTVEVNAKFFGVERQAGLPATVTLQFTVVPSPGIGVEIPVGTLARIDLLNGDFATFSTDVGVVSVVGATTVSAPATATEVGSFANNVAAGTLLDLQSPLLSVDSVRTFSASGGGQDPETDASWFSRYAAVAGSLRATLVLPSDFETAALNTVGVYRAKAIDNYDPAVGPAGSNGGHVTVAVYGAGGGTVSSTVKTALDADLEARCEANLEVHVIDPTVTTVNVVASVLALPGYDAVTVQANVRTSLLTYISTDTWKWGSTVYYFEVIGRIDEAVGVDRVTSVTINGVSADIALTGTAPLANLGTTTTTVTLAT